MPVARAIGAWLAGIRAGVYARLEEVRFRTGILVLAGSAAIVACVTAAAILAAQGGSPAAVHRPLASQARPAAPPLVAMRPPQSAARPRQSPPAAPAAHR